MRVSETRTIDGNRYTVHMLPVDTSIDILVDLIGMFGEPIAELLAADSAADIVEGLRKAGPNGEIDKDIEAKANVAMALLLKVLVGKLHKDKIHNMISHLSKVSDIDNQPLEKEYKAHFKGELLLLAKWLLFALHAQYQDFSGAFGLILGSATPRSGQVPEGS